MRPAAALSVTLLWLGACGDAPHDHADDARPAALSTSPDTPADRPHWFAETAASAGLHFTYNSGHASRFLLPEIVGGGVALIDIDNDGWLDVYFVQSGRISGEIGAAEQDAASSANRLFRNNGDGTFTDITNGSGADDRGYGMGVAVGDFDGDSLPDLYVTNLGPNVLLHNNGDGTFTDVTIEAGVGHAGWGMSAAFFDANGNGLLDLFFVNYIDWSEETELSCEDAQGRADYCHPSSYNAPTADVLYRNNGDGTFTNISVEAGIDGQSRRGSPASRFGNGLGAVCADFTGNGLTDVLIANDAGHNHLWINHGPNHDPMFTEEALRRGCAADHSGSTKAGMGIAVGDVRDRGILDVLIVNMWAERDEFFRNEHGYFVDDLASTGLSAISRSFTRFGVGFFDFDNDGYMDLYQANGRVARPLHAEPEDPNDPYAEPNLLFRGTARGRFEEILPRGGTSTPLIATSRAAAFGDIDNDGRIDIVVVNRDGPAHVLRNVAPDPGNSITFRVPNERGADALHAAVYADVGDRRLRRDSRSASSYLAANDPRVHFGLGNSDTVRNVVVHWPNGTREAFGDFDAGQFVTLQQGAGTIVE